MNLFNDLKVTIQNDLTTLGVQFDANATVEDILVLRYTLMRKSIRPRQYNPHQSAEFQAALANCSAGEKAAMAAISAKFQSGTDVNGHLSRDSTDPHKVDGLLYDWGVYHLHVSNTKQNPAQKFFDRVGPVALVKVTHTDAYFIDIRQHGVGNQLLWTQQDILGIIDRNWPALLDPFTIKLATDVAQAPSAADLKALRGDRNTGQGAAIAVLKIGNRVIMPPGGGMATSGTPNDVMEAVDRTQYAVKGIQEYLLQHDAAIKAELETKINVPAANQDFHLERANGYWVITASGHSLAINGLNSALASLPAA